MAKKKKRRLKKKIKLFIIIILFLIILLSLLLFRNKNDDIVLIDNLNLEINSEKTINDIISKSNYDIINSNDKIDTSTLGNSIINIKYKENGTNKNYKVKIKIIDTTKPNISGNENIYLTVGDDISLDDVITIEDNSHEIIKPVIDGKYDLNKKGEYEVMVNAIDSSGNKSSKKIIINVLDKIKYNGDGSLVDGTYATSKGYTVKVIDGVASINDVIIVNKTYSLPSTFMPNNPYKSIAGRGYCTDCMEDYVMEAFLKMKDDASNEGLKLWVGSGFRSYDTQVTLYNNYVNKDGKEAADTYSARAGYSEHQSGLCFDLNSDNDTFTNTKEGKWVNDNAYKYGFIIRFPKDKDKYTGYEYESWHLRYVGKELAKELYNDGDWISLEEYFGIDSKYPN